MADLSELNPEERYFLERDAAARAELRAKLEAAAKAAAAKGEIAEATGLSDEQIVAQLHALGLDGDAAGVLHLLPLVEVAWVDGQVSPAERGAILRAAEAHGVRPGTRAGLTLATMLEERPSPTLFDQLLHLLHHLLASKGMHPDNLVAACMDVAQASGGFLGMGGKVSQEERALIEKLSQTLNADEASRVTSRLNAG